MDISQIDNLTGEQRLIAEYEEWLTINEDGENQYTIKIDGDPPNWYQWIVYIYGSEGTELQGGIFKLVIDISQESLYPIAFKSQKSQYLIVKFQDPLPYHTNCFQEETNNGYGGKGAFSITSKYNFNKNYRLYFLIEDIIQLLHDHPTGGSPFPQAASDFNNYKNNNCDKTKPYYINAQQRALQGQQKFLDEI